MASKSPRNTLFEILSRRVRKKFVDLTEQKYHEALDWLIGAVQSHPFSIDLLSHSPSSRLGGSKSGTLFGFMGFQSGSNPIDELTKTLKSNIKYSVLKGRKKNELASVTISIPTKSAFSSLQRLPWTQESWPFLVEKGISGLQFYINDGKFPDSSRSGEGNQVNRVIRNADFAREDYLTPLFSEFRKRLLLGRRR